MKPYIPKPYGAAQELFVDPVLAADGFTYERSAIEGWISRKATSPMTNEPLPHLDAHPKPGGAPGSAGAEEQWLRILLDYLEFFLE